MMSKSKSRYFPGGPVAKTLCSQCRGPVLITGQGTRSCMLLLKDLTGCNEDQRSHTLQLRPNAAKQIFFLKTLKKNSALEMDLQT